MARRPLTGLSIQWKLPLVVSGLLVVTIAVLSVAAYVQVSRSVERAAEERLHAVVSQMVDALHLQARQFERRASAMADRTEIRALLRHAPTANSRSLSPALLDQMARESVVVAIELWDANGRRAVVDGTETGQIATAGSEDLVRAVATSDSGAVGRFQSMGDRVVIPAIARVVERGELLGYVVLWRRASGRAQARDQTGQLIGGEGVLYFGSTPGAWTDQATAVPAPPVDVSHLAGVARYDRPGFGQRMLAGGIVPGTPWLVALEFPRSAVMAPVRRFLSNFLIASVAVFAFGLLIAWVFGRKITQPLVALTATADAISAGGHAVRARAPSHDELGRLATAFNRMLDRVDVEVIARTASEEQWRQLFEYNPHPMWIYDRDTLALLQVNEATVRQYGYSRAEFSRMTLLDLRAAADRPELDRILASIGDDTDEVHVVRHQRKDGSSLLVEARGRPLPVLGRNARLVAATDVTVRVAADQAIHEAEARARATSEMLQSLIDVAPEPMIAVDLDLRVTRWNLAAEGLFGWTSAEVTGGPAPCFAGPAAAEGLRSAQTEPRAPFEQACVRKDGGSVKVLFAAAALRDSRDEVVGTITVLTDLTQRSLLEDQLRQSQKMEAIGRLAGGVAHDFNNLLTVITAYSGLLLEAELGDADRRSAQEITDAAIRAAALTRQLLLFSRKQVVQHQRLELGEVIAGLEPMLSRLLYENIACVTNLHTGSSAIIADKSQIEQIIVNLAVNASDAMPDGGTLSIESATVDLDDSYNQMHTDVKPGRYVMLAVSDTGIGMDQTTMGKVFEPFFTTKPAGEGTGLGLATVYAIVNELGGHVWVYSELGCGTTFKVYLPAAERTEDDRAPAIAAGATRQAVTGIETVLLVEDDEAVRRATRRMLERAQFTVLEAVDGKAGLALAEQHRDRLDLVITDLMMPGMDGRAFAEALRQAHPELQVVFVSGYTDDAVVRRGMIDSNQAFLQKPFSAQELTATIRKALHPEG